MFSSRRRHTSWNCNWSSDVCSSDLETMDPQQRVFLECAWESLEQAGYDSDLYPGMIGVFAGCDQSSYIYQIYANVDLDRKSTRLNSSHSSISYAVFCLKKKTRVAIT